MDAPRRPPAGRTDGQAASAQRRTAPRMGPPTPLPRLLHLTRRSEPRHQLPKERVTKFTHGNVRANWPGRAGSTQALLNILKTAPEAIEHTRKRVVPRSFDILVVRDMAGKFSGSGTFILGLEEAVPAFYEQVGEYLKAWQPSAPKIKGDDEVVNGTQNEIKPDLSTSQLSESVGED